MLSLITKKQESDFQAVEADCILFCLGGTRSHDLIMSYVVKPIATEGIIWWNIHMLYKLDSKVKLLLATGCCSAFKQHTTKMNALLKYFTKIIVSRDVE